MNRIMPGRWTARPQGDFVVFIIGMRINRWWMASQYLDAAGRTQARERVEKRQPLAGSLPDRSRKPSADLITLVEQALEMADAEGFACVGIDLCQALERLKAIAATAQTE